MLKGNLRRLQLAHSLLLSLPDISVLNFGTELGMGDRKKLFRPLTTMPRP